MKRTLISALTAASFLACTAHSAVLVLYDFSNQTTIDSGGLSETSTATTVAPGVTAGLYSAYGTTTNRSGISISDNAFFSSANTLATAALAVDSTTYRHEFTISATSGTLDLTDITFNYWGQGTTFTGGLVVQSSVGGYGSGNPSLADIAFTIDTVPAPGNLQTVSLGIPFQGVTSVTFRFSAYDDAALTSQTHRIDNLTINGTVVPEPSVLGLVALGGLCVLARRRRHSR